MTIADDYINNVIDYMPRAMPKRSQIAMELRGHIAERIADGQPIDDRRCVRGGGADVCHDHTDDAPLRGADLVEMVGLDPTEVMVRPLRIEPITVAREQREALAVMGLIDPLRVLIGLGAKIGEPAVHECLRRADHGDGETRGRDAHRRFAPIRIKPLLAGAPPLPPRVRGTARLACARRRPRRAGGAARFAARPALPRDRS